MNVYLEEFIVNKNKQLISAVLVLLVTILAFSSAAFAWFTINDRAEANGFAGSVKSAEGGLYLRLEGSEWTTNVDLSSVVSSSFRFVDLTTTDGINIKDIAGISASGGYIEFDLEFLTGAVYKYIYLTELNLTTPVATSWIAETTVGGVTIGDEMKARLSDAMRISVTNSTSTTKIFEKGVTTNGVDEFPNTTGFGGFALAYYQVMGTSLTAPAARGDIALGTNGVTLTYLSTSSTTNVPIHDLDESYNHYEKMTIRIWFEGWDGEAFNAVASGLVNIDFSFRVFDAIQ